mmetsp:Transcript_68368/g.200026  ORF Transcript_68368/g.200026 Transcript_68368/m.200026 type:complete len:234 (-) Transcript_68368:1553-2254(-)
MGWRIPEEAQLQLQDVRVRVPSIQQREHCVPHACLPQLHQTAWWRGSAQPELPHDAEPRDLAERYIPDVIPHRILQGPLLRASVAGKQHAEGRCHQRAPEEDQQHLGCRWQLQECLARDPDSLPACSPSGALVPPPPQVLCGALDLRVPLHRHRHPHHTGALLSARDLLQPLEQTRRVSAAESSLSVLLRRGGQGILGAAWAAPCCRWRLPGTHDLELRAQDRRKHRDHPRGL